PLGVAAANWAATGWLVAQRVKNCVVVDVGSTSASIIPIVDGQFATKAKTDLDKLMCGELVYTGSLRTNVATIVHSVPVKNGVAGVASELFALSGDVHLALGNITEKEYTCETADGRGKTLPEALARLARVVCADTEMLTQQEIVNIAKYIYDKQVIQVAEGLTKVYSYTKALTSSKVPVVVTGLGKDFIARKAAEKIGVDAIVDLGALMQNDAVVATPAFGVALMTASELEGEIIKWMPQ
ncbi:H4MPT-linked C1 transfer pathway protein, partial [Candidatus Bathyarchaeota archaeon]|nr:H4MPT-linked C1 transfer pathway protein [Candidatus Bathyarchaeota archaeon]